MPCIGRGMAIGDGTLYFPVRDASMKDFVNTSLEQERIIPVVVVEIMEELFILLIGQIWRQNCGSEVVDKIGVPQNGRFSSCSLLYFCYYVRAALLEVIWEMSVSHLKNTISCDGHRKNDLN